MTVLPTKAQQDALIKGYTKSHTKCIKYTTFPFALIQLCYLYYNEIRRLKFSGDQLKEFLSTTDDDYWEDKPINLKGIELQIIMTSRVCFRKIRISSNDQIQ